VPIYPVISLGYELGALFDPQSLEYLAAAYFTAVKPLNSVPSPLSIKTSAMPSFLSTFNFKWGDIYILDEENYATFAVDAKMAFAVADAWTIVNGTEEPFEDRNNQAARDIRNSYNKCRLYTIAIINKGAFIYFKHFIEPFIDDSNVVGMWNALKVADCASDSIYMNRVWNDFNIEGFSLLEETIFSFLKRLQAY